MQENALQDHLQYHALEQEIFWAQQAQRDRILLGEKILNIFKCSNNKKKTRLYMRNHDRTSIWFEDQYNILQVFLEAFHRSFKNDPEH